MKNLEERLDKKFHVFINGAGTVGLRNARLLLSLGAKVSLGKRTVSPDDPKSREIKELIREFGALDVYLADGEDADERILTARAQGFPVVGCVGPTDMRMGVPFHRFDAVIDSTDNGSTAQNVKLYKNYPGLAYIVQGGADHRLADQDFLGAPHCIGADRFDSYVGTSARQVSCNTTACGTLLGLLLEVIEPKRIAGLDAGLRRRYQDPGEEKTLLKKPTVTEENSHHTADLERVIPTLKGSIHTNANKNPWEHYHRFDITLALKSGLSQHEQDQITHRLRSYERGIYTTHDLGGPSVDEVQEGIMLLRLASASIGIPDGDCLFPVYTAWFPSPRTVRIAGFTPQRSVTAPSCLDGLWAVTGLFKSYDEAATYTNSAKWYGHSFASLKLGMELALNKGDESVTYAISPSTLANPLIINEGSK